MRMKILQVLAMVLAAFPVLGLAQAPKDGVYISDDDVKAVLKHSVDTKRTIPDNTLRVIDMDKYQLGVAVIHRGAMGGGGAANAAAAANPSPACGGQRPDAKGPTGIFHDDTAESYVVLSGSATLITGGTIVQDCRHFAVWGRTPPVDDGAPSNQRPPPPYYDVTPRRILLEDAGGALWRQDAALRMPVRGSPPRRHWRHRRLPSPRGE